MAWRKTRRRQCGAKRRVGAQDMGQSAAQDRPYASVACLNNDARLSSSLQDTFAGLFDHYLEANIEFRIRVYRFVSLDPRTRVIVSFAAGNCLVEGNIYDLLSFPSFRFFLNLSFAFTFTLCNFLFLRT